MTERSQVLLVVCSALLGAVFLFAALPTLVQVSIGGFKSRTLFDATSPDGRYRVVGIVSVDFPANQILEPSGTVLITLSDSQTRESLDQVSIGLHEAEEFKTPTIVWNPNGRVQVQDFENRGHMLSVTLSPQAWR